MKRIIYAFLTGLLMLACSFSQSITPAAPNVETMVAGTLQAITPAVPLPTTLSTAETIASPQPVGNRVSHANVSFNLPAGVATSVLAGTIPAVTGDDPGWGLAPEHIKFELDGYALYNTFHTPQILIYPAQEYAVLNEGAGRSITSLRAILNGSATPTADNLPAIAFFNAGQVFAGQIQVIQFRNGSGVRFLAEYGQYYATANNVDLFYQFQGLTSDGKYYIIAILPVSHPYLASDANRETVPPVGGIPFPSEDDQGEFITYYTNVVNLLNTAAPESYNPMLTNIDALIQSIEIH